MVGVICMKSIKDSLHDFENSGISFANSKKDFTQIIEDLINNKKIHMDRSKFKKTYIRLPLFM